MAFALYTDPNGLDAERPEAAPSTNRVWSSWGEGETVGTAQTTEVQVRNGRFLVYLGGDNEAPLANSIFDQRPLHVVVWVVKSAGSVFRLPAQVLEKVPHAVTAERGSRSCQHRDCLQYRFLCKSSLLRHETPRRGHLHIL